MAEPWFRGDASHNPTTTENARVQQHAGRSEVTNQKEHQMGTTLFSRPASGLFGSRPRGEPARLPMAEGRLIVTPAAATQILADHHYAGQRRVIKKHVSVLAHEMESKVWTPGSQLAFAALPDNQMILVNGYHRLHAVIASGQVIEFQVLIVPARDLDDVQSLYYRFDTVQANRSDRMVLASLGLAERLDIGRDTLVGAYKAGIVIGNGLKQLPSALIPVHLGTPDGKLAAISQYWPQVKIYDGIVGGSESHGTRRRMRLPGVMAVALVTLKHQPKKAVEFWSGAAQDDGLAKGDPRKVLIKIMAEGDRSDTWGALMIYAANCWNAFYQGRTLDHTKAYKASECRPLGTPFSGLKRDQE